MKEMCMHPNCHSKSKTHLPAKPLNPEEGNNTQETSCSELTLTSLPLVSPIILKFLPTTRRSREHSVPVTWPGWLSWSTITFWGSRSNGPLWSWHSIRPMLGLVWQGGTVRTRLSLLACWCTPLLRCCHSTSRCGYLSWKACSTSRMAHIPQKLIWKPYSSWDQVSKGTKSWRWALNPSNDASVNGITSGGREERKEKLAGAQHPVTMPDAPQSVK